MHNFNAGLLCAVILLLHVSMGNGLKCYKCKDETQASKPKLDCQTVSDATEIHEVNASPGEKAGCMIWKRNVDDIWRFEREGYTFKDTDTTGSEKCAEFKRERNYPKAECSFCFTDLCNSSVSIRANSFICCIVVFAWFINFVSSNLLAE